MGAGEHTHGDHHDVETSPQVRVVLVEREVENLKKHLYGNGRPGKLKTLEDKIDELREMIIALNEKFVKLTAALLVIAFGSGGGVGYLIKSILGG